MSYHSSETNKLLDRVLTDSMHIRFPRLRSLWSLVCVTKEHVSAPPQKILASKLDTTTASPLPTSTQHAHKNKSEPTLLHDGQQHTTHLQQQQQPQRLASTPHGHPSRGDLHRSLSASHPKSIGNGRPPLTNAGVQCSLHGLHRHQYHQSVLSTIGCLPSTYAS